MNSLGTQSYSSSGSSGMSKGKKAAPPRPPQPNTTKLKNSQSFHSSQEIKNKFERSQSLKENQIVVGSDLIDFSSPNKSAQVTIQSGPPEFMYRVGASIFYVKSELKSSNRAPSGNPFSPPRPSPESLNNSTMLSKVQQSQGPMTPITVKTNPTIIRPDAQRKPTILKPVVATKPVLVKSGTQPQQPRYSNFPLEWDEPPVKLPQPIQPAPIGKPLSHNAAAIQKALNDSSSLYYDVPPEQDYYDEPPGEDFEDSKYDNNGSPPMPDIPPPPPPQDFIEDDDDVNDHLDLPNPPLDEIYSEPYQQSGAEADRACAIALYDYAPEAEGDLPLQAGDLVYLIRQVDDSWTIGTCGGLEGMFPSNYVNIVVPLCDNESVYDTVPFIPEVAGPNKSENEIQYHIATVLFDFTAEAEGDLNLNAGGFVIIMGRINEDWLYGELDGKRGQFPQNFVEPVPENLPILAPPYP